MYINLSLNGLQQQKNKDSDVTYKHQSNVLNDNLKAPANRDEPPSAFQLTVITLW